MFKHNCRKKYEKNTAPFHEVNKLLNGSLHFLSDTNYRNLSTLYFLMKNPCVPYNTTLSVVLITKGERQPLQLRQLAFSEQ